MSIKENFENIKSAYEQKQLKRDELYHAKWILSSEIKDQHGINIPIEMFDFIEPLVHSAKLGKYKADNWLDADGKGTDVKSNYASINRHAAEYYCGSTADKDNGLHPLLAVAVRALMAYTRYCKGIEHPLDKQQIKEQLSPSPEEEHELLVECLREEQHHLSSCLLDELSTQTNPYERRNEFKRDNKPTLDDKQNIGLTKLWSTWEF